MKDGKAFLRSLEKNAKMFAPSARATYEANEALCSWLLNPLARWAEAAYGDRAFEDAAKGYAKYCLGVWKSQQLYEKNRPVHARDYAGTHLGGVRRRRLHGSLHVGGDFDLSFLALNDQPHLLISRRLSEIACRPGLKSWSWPRVME